VTTDRARLLSSAMMRVLMLLSLLTAAMIGLGFLVTRVLVHVWPFTLENQAVRALVADRTPTLDRASNAVSLIAYTAGLGIVIVVVGGTMRIAYHRWRESLFLAAAIVCQFEVFSITAVVVARARPPVPKLDSRRPAHAAAWFAVLLIIPVAVAISRVYRGMHYPSDVAASFIGGSGCLWILHRTMFPRANPSAARGLPAP